MKKLFAALLSAILLAGAQAQEPLYEIDSVATANAPWKVGEVVYAATFDPQHPDREQRLIAAMMGVTKKVNGTSVFMGVTKEGFYVLQDYHENGEVVGIPTLVLNLQNADGTGIDVGLQHGRISSKHSNGEKWLECTYDYGTTTTPCIMWWDTGEKNLEFTRERGSSMKITYINIHAKPFMSLELE